MYDTFTFCSTNTNLLLWKYAHYKLKCNYSDPEKMNDPFHFLLYRYMLVK